MLKKIKREVKELILFIRDFCKQTFRKERYASENTDLNRNNTNPNIVKADTSSDSNFIVTCVVLSNGDIIVARSGGKVVRISKGCETTVLYIPGAEDWRGLWQDSRGNVFISPHCTPSLGSIELSSRGIYKLSPNDNHFRMVHRFYNPNSDIITERDINDDTIWTFCEDEEGGIYAGVYAHTIRNNPSIYKSTDNGESWCMIYNFNDAGILSNGRHIHGITYSKEEKALFSLVGEVNDLFKSTDGGHSWRSLDAHCELAKGSALYAAKDGIVIGSDSAYDLIMSKYYFKDRKVKTVFRLTGSTVFAIRHSDLTGRLYAFSKIDSSVRHPSYFPPFSAMYSKIDLLKWLWTSGANRYGWILYHLRMRKRYPEDKIIPQHNYILMSEDNGDSWNVIFKDKTTYKGPNGFWVTGFFNDGECLTSYMDASLKFVNPFILCEKQTIETLSPLI